MFDNKTENKLDGRFYLYAFFTLETVLPEFFVLLKMALAGMLCSYTTEG